MICVFEYSLEVIQAPQHTLVSEAKVKLII